MYGIKFFSCIPDIVKSIFCTTLNWDSNLGFRLLRSYVTYFKEIIDVAFSIINLRGTVAELPITSVDNKFILEFLNLAFNNRELMLIDPFVAVSAHLESRLPIIKFTSNGYGIRIVPLEFKHMLNLRRFMCFRSSLRSNVRIILKHNMALVLSVLFRFLAIVFEKIILIGSRIELFLIDNADISGKKLIKAPCTSYCDVTH